jgi:hypothetical protein
VEVLAQVTVPHSFDHLAGNNTIELPGVSVGGKGGREGGREGG